MSNAYRLYGEDSDDGEAPKEMQQMALEIARDVHEIKKDTSGLFRELRRNR